MDDYRTKEELFDAICRKEFLRYIKNKCETYPSKEELDAMYSVPKRGRRRLLRAIKAERYGKSLLTVYIRRAAVILLVTVTVAFGVLMTNTEVRAAIINAFIKWNEKNIEFDFSVDDPVSDSSDSSNNSDSSEVNINSIKIDYVPKHMYLTYALENDNVRIYTYLDSSNENVDLMIEIHYDNNIGAFVDNEEYDYQEIEINNKKAYCLYDEKSNDGIIILNDNGFTIVITGNIQKNELIKIAENIVFK